MSTNTRFESFGDFDPLALLVLFHESEHVVGDHFPELEDHLLLDLGCGQSVDVELAIETERDHPVGTNQSLARNRPARQGFEDLDKEQVGRLDRVGKLHQRTFVGWRGVGNGRQVRRLDALHAREQSEPPEPGEGRPVACVPVPPGLSEAGSVCPPLGRSRKLVFLPQALDQTGNRVEHTGNRVAADQRPQRVSRRAGSVCPGSRW